MRRTRQPSDSDRLFESGRTGLASLGNTYRQSALFIRQLFTRSHGGLPVETAEEEGRSVSEDNDLFARRYITRVIKVTFIKTCNFKRSPGAPERPVRVKARPFRE